MKRAALLANVLMLAACSASSSPAASDHYFYCTLHSVMSGHVLVAPADS